MVSICCIPGGLTERVLRHVGFLRLDGIDLLAAVLALGPDLVMLVASIAIYLVIRKMSTAAPSRTPFDTLPPPAVVGGFSFLTAKSKYSQKEVKFTTKPFSPHNSQGKNF